MEESKIQILLAEPKKGGGSFPIDMLRYDSAWPSDESDSRKIASGNSGPIYLKRFAVGGGLPTYARWLSFGWTVRIVDREGDL